MMYDAAIIGTGPAGLSAALNLKLHNKSVLWFGSADMSVKVEKSEKIANYPGVPMVSGAELNRILRSQAAELGLEITDRMVTNIMPSRKGFMLLGGNDIYEAKTVLFAIGAVSPKGFQGEDRLLGRGVSYCATCDGFLYRGKTIAVYCGAKQFEHEVRYLAELADTVYLFTPYSDAEIDLPNVRRTEKPMKGITGEEQVNGILLTDGTALPLDGVFLLRPSVAAGVLLPGLETDRAHIVTDRNMRTNRPGAFAAGDCTGRPYQIAKAVGEGNVAAHEMLAYLAEFE